MLVIWIGDVWSFSVKITPHFKVLDFEGYTRRLAHPAKKVRKIMTSYSIGWEVPSWRKIKTCDSLKDCNFLSWFSHAHVIYQMKRSTVHRQFLTIHPANQMMKFPGSPRPNKKELFGIHMYINIYIYIFIGVHPQPVTVTPPGLLQYIGLGDSKLNL